MPYLTKFLYYLMFRLRYTHFYINYIKSLYSDKYACFEEVNYEQNWMFVTVYSFVICVLPHIVAVRDDVACYQYTINGQGHMISTIFIRFFYTEEYMFGSPIVINFYTRIPLYWNPLQCQNISFKSCAAFCMSFTSFKSVSSSYWFKVADM